MQFPYFSVTKQIVHSKSFPLHNILVIFDMEVNFMSGYAGGGSGMGFALIVVLFILLIIVGASYVGGGMGGY